MIAARPLLRAALAALLVTAGTLLTPATAQAETGGLLDVTITDISRPLLDLAEPDAVVQLSGTLINTSASRISYVNVHFWRSQDPITTRAALDGALASEATDPLGARLFSDEMNLDPVTGEGYLSPGERARFTVRATIAQLDFRATDAIYLLGVHVRGIPEGAAGNETVGRGRILAVATRSPLTATEVVELTAAPTRLADGDFRDESLLTEIAGRLDALLALAERPGATLLVDPSLLSEAEALGTAHTVAGVDRPGRPEAADWAARVRRLIRGGAALRLPFADPALARSQASGDLDGVLARSEAIPTAATGRLPVAADLRSFATDELVSRVRAAGVTTILADNAAGPGGLGDLVPVASSTLSGMGPGGSRSTAQQLTRRLAEEFLAPSPRVYVIREAADADALLAPSDPLRVLVPLGRVPARATLGPAAPVPAPWLRLSDRLRDLDGSTDFLKDLTGIDEGAAVDLVAARAWSARFTSEQQALDFVAANPVATLDPGQVTISAARQFVMGARTSSFPVTVTNRMPTPVTVRLVFDSDAPQRIDVPPTELVTISPGENLTLNVEPHASANGVVDVSARLQTRGGTEFGEAVPIEVTATDLGRVGWILIIVSGAVVLGGTFWRIRAVQAENAKRGRSGAEGQ